MTSLFFIIDNYVRGGGIIIVAYITKGGIELNFGVLVFLNANFYEKDGQPRCYASFANYESGEVMSFACHQWRSSDKPDLFDLCEVRGELRQYGRSVSFVLKDYDVVGKLEEVSISA